MDVNGLQPKWLGYDVDGGGCPAAYKFLCVDKSTVSDLDRTLAVATAAAAARSQPTSIA